MVRIHVNLFVKSASAMFPRGYSSSTCLRAFSSSTRREIDDFEVNSYNTTYKFMDRVRVEVRGGRGGNGCVSHQVLSPGRKRPNGGNGGPGGNIYIVADRGLNGLSFQTFHFNAGNGTNGGSDGLTGRSGEDVYIRVPVGTIVSQRIPDSLEYLFDNYDENNDNDDYSSNNDSDEDDDEEGLGAEMPRVDLDKHGTTLLVAEGGEAGLGNMNMSGTGTSRKRSMPLTKIPGKLGEHKSLLLELKLIADVGLVGYPNAGKSTLLKALSNARPKIAPYPFTTLHPNIGVVQYSDLEKLTVADIPGLVEGASENRGLGHDFLRHIERTKVLMYVVDLSVARGAGGLFNNRSFRASASTGGSAYKRNGAEGLGENTDSDSEAENSGEKEDDDSDSESISGGRHRGRGRGRSRGKGRGNINGRRSQGLSEDIGDDELEHVLKERSNRSGNNNNSTSNNISVTGNNNSNSSSGSGSGSGRGRGPVEDLRSLIKELALYDPKLANRPALVFGNKTDLSVDPEEVKLLEMEVKKMGMQLFLGSADKGVGIGPVAETLRVMVERLSKQ